MDTLNPAPSPAKFAINRRRLLQYGAGIIPSAILAPASRGLAAALTATSTPAAAEQIAQPEAQPETNRHEWIGGY